MVAISKVLIDEHENLERELIELEFIIRSSPINYPNLKHVLKKIISLWEEHEKKEEDYFKLLDKKEYGIIYDKILFEHGKLKKYRVGIEKAIKSGSEQILSEELERSGVNMVMLLREHMKKEDEVLYRIPALLN